MPAPRTQGRAIAMSALAVWFALAIPPGAAAQPPPLRSHPGEPRAWTLLARAAAWSDSLRRPAARFWLEFETSLPCGPGSAGQRRMTIRVARAGDARLSYDVVMDPGPSGVRVRYDGRRFVEHSLSGSTAIVVDGPPSAVKSSLAGQAGGFAANMAMGLMVSSAVTYDTTRAAASLGPESLVVDGRVRQCERVRLYANAHAQKAYAEDFWIDRETGCPWRSATVDSAGHEVPGQAGARYTFVRQGVSPPDSVFAATVPPGTRSVADLESTRPHSQVDPRLAPHIAADGTAAFRWTGEARRVALVGSFNCWDPAADPMVRGADGTWTCTHAVDRNQFNDYLFLVDGTRFLLDPLNPGCRGDGFGGWMSIVLEPSAPRPAR